MSRAGDILQRALNEMRTKGYARYIRHMRSEHVFIARFAENPVGGVCALGAIECALGVHDERNVSYDWHCTSKDYRVATRALAAVVPADHMPEYTDSESRVATYNNTHSWPEVEALFEKAIANEGVSSV